MCSLVHFLGPSLSLGHFLSSESTPDFIKYNFCWEAKQFYQGRSDFSTLKKLEIIIYA